MRVRILGSAAGGGFPQWNCVCRNCVRLRAGVLNGKARTQTQIAFSPLLDVWFLINASPDLRTQILNTPDLTARPQIPGTSPIAGVLLPSADVDAVLGLLHLREFHNFFVFSTSSVQKLLKTENAMFKMLERGEPPVQWQTLAPGGRMGCHLSENSEDPPTFFCGAVPLGGSYPEYASEGFGRSASPEEAVIGFMVEQGGKKLFVAPSLSGENNAWIKAVYAADVVLLDGTFWSDDELTKTGRSSKSARAMGHLPLSGFGGLLEQFPQDIKARKILLHINSTNPILDEDSAEHRAVLEAGFEIAYDGMEFSL